MSEICGINGNGYYNWGDGPCFPVPDSTVSSNPSAKKKTEISKPPSRMASVKTRKHYLVCSIDDTTLPIIEIESQRAVKEPVPINKDGKGAGTVSNNKRKSGIYFGNEVSIKDQQYIFSILGRVTRLIPPGISNRTVFGRNGTLKAYFMSSAQLPWSVRLKMKVMDVLGFYSNENVIVVLTDLNRSTHHSMIKLPSMRSWVSPVDLMLTSFFHELGHAIYFNNSAPTVPAASKWYEQIPIIGAGFKEKNIEKGINNFFNKLFGLYPKPPSFFSYQSGIPNGEELFADSFSYWAYLKAHGKNIDYRRASGIFPHGSCARSAVETLYTIEKFMANDGDQAFFENIKGPF